jgi:hypothetical protein
VAEYRFEAQMISRADGRFATAAAAYRAGACIFDERTGVTHDYTRKGGVAHTEILAPEAAPDWAHDREALWNEVEKAETRINSQVAREVLLSLPSELSHEQRVVLTRDFVQDHFVAKGMVADIAIHEPPKGGDERNHHAHIMLTTREIGPEGFTVKNRDWNRRETLQEWREGWAIAQNRHLENVLGKGAPQLTHKSYAEQGLTRLPGRHLGPEATAIERRGGASIKGEIARNEAREHARIGETGKVLKDKIAAAMTPPGTKNLAELSVELEGMAGRMSGEKAQAQQRLKDIQEQMKTARRITKSLVKKESIAPLEKAEFEAKKELEKREAEAKAGRDLDAKTIMRWVTNPAEMLWKSAREQMARDSAANAAGAKLKGIQAQKKEALEWLKTPGGGEFIKSRVAQIRASSPDMFEAAERVQKAGKAKSHIQKVTKSAQGKEIIAGQVKKLQGDLGALRTEERKARRNVAQLDRNINAARGVAKVARDMFENDIPSTVRLPSRTLGDSRYVKAAFGEVRRNVQALAPEQQKALTLNLRRVLSLGLGG